MNFLQILILGLVQGAAELLPVSSSAHVIVAEKLMGLDPSSPEMTFLLVMLHTGTMVAVIVYFWNSWLDHYCSDASHLGSAAKNIAVATVITVIVGLILQWIIEKIFLHGQAKAEIESLFSQLPLIGGALLAAGLLILYSGVSEEKWPGARGIDGVSAAIIGAVQGICLPFRGFSRSGGTISAGLLLGIERRQIEEFSFALAVVLTPLVVVKELWRLVKAHPEITHGHELVKLLTPGLLGMVCSFGAGFLALKLLSRLLETGRWKYFGYYCLVASAVVFGLAYTEKTASSAPDTTTLQSTLPEGASVPSSDTQTMSGSTPTPAVTNQPVVPSPDLSTNASTPATPQATPPAPATNTDAAPASSMDQSATAPPASNTDATSASPATNIDTMPNGPATNANITPAVPVGSPSDSSSTSTSTSTNTSSAPTTNVPAQQN